MKPLAVDLCCGLGGWTEGLLAEGWDVVGFDIERHVYGDQKYPAQLVIQDILTLDGRQFRGKVSLITASPPCQFFSYTAMPWSRAKALAAKVQADADLLQNELALFNACIRIGQEAECPIIIENVRGAQPWVGRARWGYGSFMLWGDVPALMPITAKAIKVPSMGAGWYPPDHPKHVKGLGFNTHAERNLRIEQAGIKNGGDWFGSGEDCSLQRRYSGTKNTGGSWFNIAHNTTSGKGQNPDGRKTAGHQNIRDGHRHTRHLTNPGEHVDFADGLKQPGIGGERSNGKGDAWFQDGAARHGSKSKGRKMASAMIAKIPLPLSRHIAATFRPQKNI